MGWNSWDCYGPTVVESEVKANADYMAAHLKRFGWEYIVVDIRWYVSNDKSHGYNETDPDYVIDRYGRFLPAINRFPSAKGGKGFAPLADYIHKKGLKFGIHMMRGVPVIAVKNASPIQGTTLTAKDIYSDKQQSTWLHDMYTIDANKQGGQEYYNSVFKLYASWGLDFVKVDDLTAPYHAEELEMIRKAIDHCGRKIVLSTSPGETPIDRAPHIQEHANMWRTVGDFWDSWQQLKEHFQVFERWNQYRQKGGWPDGDMLPLGHIGIRAERGIDRMSNFTRDEQYTLMTLWSIFRSPLMFGGDLPSNDSFTLSLLTNKHVMNLLSSSRNNRQLFRKGDKIAWVAEDVTTNEKYLALFNAADHNMAVEERAIWKSKNIGRANNVGEYFEVKINGARKLFLVVTDGKDNIDWDHADWIAPRIHNERDSISLTNLKWRKATAGWSYPHIDSSSSGNKLIVNERSYSNGIGTHSNSVIEYELPSGYNTLTGMVGLDQAGVQQDAGATVQFLIFTEDPSGPMPPESESISISLEELGFNGEVNVQDLWSGQFLGSFSNEFAPIIRRHGAGLYKLSVKK